MRALRVASEATGERLVAAMTEAALACGDVVSPGTTSIRTDLLRVGRIPPQTADKPGVIGLILFEHPFGPGS